MTTSSHSPSLVDDERAITRSLYDYCDYVDRCDFDGILSIFSPDGQYDLGLGRVFRGHDQLRDMFSRITANQATSHHVSNVCIDVDGDRARVRSVLYAYHLRRADQSEVHVWGQYHDTFVRDGDRWLVQERALRVAAEKGGVPESGRPSLYEFLPRG